MWGHINKPVSIISLLKVFLRFWLTVPSDSLNTGNSGLALTNTSKLREFVEELKRLKIDIIRPSINKCFAEFTVKPLEGSSNSVTVVGEALGFLKTSIDTRVYFIKNF